MNFNNSVYTREGNSWKASTLCSFAKEKGYKVEEIPLQDINLNATLFPMNNFKDFILEVKSLLDCSLEYPIIIDDRGVVADGYPWEEGTDYEEVEDENLCSKIIKNYEKLGYYDGACDIQDMGDFSIARSRYSDDPWLATFNKN